MSNEVQKAWVMSLEQIVVPGETIDQAVTNCIDHLAKHAEQGIYPNVIEAKQITLKVKDPNDSTDKE